MNTRVCLADTWTPRTSVSDRTRGRAFLPQMCRASHCSGPSPALASNRARSCSKGKLFTTTDSGCRKQQWLGWRPEAHRGLLHRPARRPNVTDAWSVRLGSHMGRGCTWDSPPLHSAPAPPRPARARGPCPLCSPRAPKPPAPVHPTLGARAPPRSSRSPRSSAPELLQTG